MCWERNKILNQLDHPNIIKLYDTFQDNLSLYFVVEYAPSGSLADYLHQKGTLSYELTRFYAAELVNAIGEYLLNTVFTRVTND